jgi:uncharacterized membrane protein
MVIRRQAEESGGQRIDDLGQFNRRIKSVLVALFVVVVLVVGFYFGKFRGELGNQEVFAQFGDYFGGVLNPMLGFATVALLIYSIRLQAKELRNTTEELRLTREEMGVATMEAARSAEAATSQIELMHSREQIKDATKALEVYEGRFGELFEFKWPFGALSSSFRDAGIPIEGGERSFKVILDDYRKEPDSINIDKETFSKLESPIGCVPYINFKKEVLEITERMAGCVCLLIKLGVEFRLCEFQVENVRILMKRAYVVGLISDIERQGIQKGLEEHIEARQTKEPSFAKIPNREVDIVEVTSIELSRALNQYNDWQSDN